MGGMPHVKHWHHQFKCGRTSVETAPIPGRPQLAIDEDTIWQVEAAISEDHHITVHQLAQDVKVIVGSVDKIIHDHLHMRKLSARWVPRLLTPFQKQEKSPVLPGSFDHVPSKPGGVLQQTNHAG